MRFSLLSFAVMIGTSFATLACNDDATMAPPSVAADSFLNPDSGSEGVDDPSSHADGSVGPGPSAGNAASDAAVPADADD